MYESPIEIVYCQMQTQIEGDILKAVQQVGVHVDKEELIRRWNYSEWNKGEHFCSYGERKDNA